MRRKSRIILGLNSGTSADGVDAVACEISGRGLNLRVRVIGHVARRYPIEFRKRLLAVMAQTETRTEEICRLHTGVGRFFASAAEAAVKKLALKCVDLVGSHGQTVCHLPPRRARRGNGRIRRKRGNDATGTLQIGDASVIALALDAPVVSDFRHADMAAGGQGAPLVPWTDYVLFRHPRHGRVIQNIGGIANLTFIPAGAEIADVVAFDTGPGNLLLDGFVRHFTKGKRSLDRDGRLARWGRVRRFLYNRMLKHPFLDLSPPKSCGREEFGESYVRELIERYSHMDAPLADWLATAVTFTAQTISSAYDFYLDRFKPGRSLDEVILCGGGARNKSLVDALMEAAGAIGRGDIRFSKTDDYGIPIQAKECVSFAMLAAACVDRIPANLPHVTGAKRQVVLGQTYDPTGWQR